MEEIGQRLTDLSWAGGLLDGEGCLRVGVRSIEVTVESTSKVTIEKLHTVLTGNCFASPRRTSTGRQVFIWRAHGRVAKAILKQLIPYLVEKRKQAALLICYYRYPPNSAMREAITRRMKQLKRTV